jgi:hypothetical protein
VDVVRVRTDAAGAHALGELGAEGFREADIAFFEDAMKELCKGG